MDGSAVDELEPVAAEHFAFVGGVPVAVDEGFAFGVGEMGKLLRLPLEVEIRVVSSP